MDPSGEKPTAPLFVPLQAGDAESGIMQIESFCVECHKNGETRLLLTKIPFYKDVVIMSFSCPHCGYINNEIQSAGKIEEKGVKYELTVTTRDDFNRKVIKSDFATVEVPSLELTVPGGTQKGEITTVEGVLQRVVRGLTQEQPMRKALDPENAAKIEDFISRIQKTMELEKPFNIILNDPSGCSFIENPLAPAADPHLVMSQFVRTPEENHLLGLFSAEEVAAATSDGEAEAGQVPEAKPEGEGENEILKDEVMTIMSNCPDCNAPCEVHMKVQDIPMFKEIIIMACRCEACGHKSNEVKSSVAIAEKGKKIILKLTDPEMDMSRDVLKSYTCSFSIPDLELEIGPGTMAGRFTTLEGLLGSIQESLTESNPFYGGDSTGVDVKKRFEEVVKSIEEVKTGKKLVTVVLDDPAGNSYLQNVYAPDEDPNMETVEYERSFEQNEELGLNDMKVENYSEPSAENQ